MEEDGMVDLVAEMAALGLPSSFIAGLGHFPSTSRRKSKGRPSSSSHSRTGADRLRQEGCTDSAERRATDEDAPQPSFCVRSVRLYTPKVPGVSAERCDALCSIAVQPDTALIDGDAANVPACSASMCEHSEVGGLGGLEESYVVNTVDVRWEPVWDEHYQCYYFCNAQTLESTWEPPPGFKNYAATSLLADQHTISLVRTQDSSLGLVCDGKMISDGCRDSGLTVCPIRVVVEQRDDDEEGRLSSVQKVDRCRDETSDSTMEGSSLDEIQFLPGFTNSHIRFRDGDDSDSWSTGEGQDGGVDSTEIRDEIPSQSRNENDVEEEKDDCEACSHGSVSSFQFKVRQHIDVSEMGSKKRRLRNLSKGDHLDEIQLNEIQLPGIAGKISKDLIKYWIQRYSLFTKFDEGVKLDEEGWFSVTPETIAKHQASRCVTGLVIDAFTGVGGNAIQFAVRSYRVIAIDINPTRIEYARHNAEIYGVSDKIEFIVGDFFQLAPFLKADLVFLSPPWGGPEYLKQEIYDLQTMLKPKDGITLFKAAQSIAPNVALFVPRNVDLNQLQELSWLTSPPRPCEVEENYVNDKLKAITAYYGDIAGQDL